MVKKGEISLKFLLAILLTLSTIQADKIDLDIQADDLDSGYTDYEKWHEYSGYITLGLVGATLLTKFDRGMHEGFGTAAAISMVGTSGLGIYAHKDDVFDLSEGFQKIHWHSLIGAMASVAMVATLATAPEDMHATFGTIGGISAVVSFVIVKW